LRFLMREAGPVDVSWVYAESGGNLEDLRSMSERGLVRLGESEVWRDPLQQYDFQPSQPPVLTRDQLVVWAEVEKRLDEATSGQPVPPVLLHGVTGSGKTEIYLHAVHKTLASGRQAIVLVPEIALTPQTLRRFAGRFPGQVGVIHSRLSAGERYDTWRRARAGELGLVIGPRSALFTPFDRLGLIVVDECHDDSIINPRACRITTRPRNRSKDAEIAERVLVGPPPRMSSVFTGGRRRLALRLPAHSGSPQAVQAQIARLENQGLRPSCSRSLPPPGGASWRQPTCPVEIIDMREEFKSATLDLQPPLQSAPRRCWSGVCKPSCSEPARYRHLCLLPTAGTP
jgi:primosomal protein N' (replication factor Y)